MVKVQAHLPRKETHIQYCFHAPHFQHNVELAQVMTGTKLIRPPAVVHVEAPLQRI
jgi:hypothetical protein